MSRIDRTRDATTTGAPADRSSALPRWAHRSLWAMQMLAALAFAAAGGAKLLGVPVGGSPVPALVLLVVTATIAWFRRPNRA